MFLCLIQAVVCNRYITAHGIDFHKLFIKTSGNVVKQEFKLEKAVMIPFVYIPNDKEE